MALTKIKTSNIINDGNLGRRNLIINGAMQVAQRGTTFSSMTTDDYALDRYYVFGSTGATTTVTQETLTVGQTDLPTQFRNYMRLACNGGEFGGFAQRIEDVSKYYGTFKLSFYAKGTNPTGGSFQQRMIQRFGSGGSSQVITDNGTFTVTSSWQRFEIDVTIPSVSGKTIGSNNYIQFQFTQPNGDTGTDAWTLDITGIQLEVGDTATPFEHRSFGEELVMCQRYYQKLWFRSYNVFTDYTGNQYASQSLVNPIRTSATVTHDGSTGANITITSITTRNDTAIEIVCASSGNHNNWVTADIYVDAEL